MFFQLSVNLFAEVINRTWPTFYLESTLTTPTMWNEFVTNCPRRHKRIYSHDLCYLLFSALGNVTTTKSRAVFAGLVSQLRKAMVNRQLSDSQQISTLSNVFFYE